ncbi:hypothetical protein FI667_g12703, partial [Globisporangium splendens]
MWNLRILPAVYSSARAVMCYVGIQLPCTHRPRKCASAYNGQRHYNHEWHLHTSEATLTHVDTTLVKATNTVHSAMDCDVMATRDLNGQKVSFHAHPRFTRIVQLWGGNGRYNTTRSFYRNKLQQRGHKLAKILEMQQSTKLSIQQDLCGQDCN